MKKTFMFIFSVIYTVFAVATLLVAAELVLTAYGNPMLSPEFWKTEWITNLFISWEMDNIGMFISGVLIFMQVFCFILHVVCAKIGNSIMEPQKEYSSKKKFRGFTRRNFLFSRIAHLIFIASFAAHIWEFVPAGDIGFGNGEFVQTCIILGLPGLIFALVTISRTISIIFLGMPNFGYCYCDNCNHGCLKQFTITHKEHLYDMVSSETTTTRVGGNVTNVEKRETGRRRVYRNTYSCKNCNASFTKVE